MALRSWLIRGTILAALAVLAVGGWLASAWVSPEAVRGKVLAHLTEQLEGVEVQVESARMRIFGGIAVTNLKLFRQGDPTDRPFFSVPSAVLYHDKEQLNRGRLVIRKVELDNPELWLERAPNGSWNLLGIVKHSSAEKPMEAIPTVVGRGATLHFLDHSPGNLPPVTLTQARFTLLNDPLPVLNIEAQAGCDTFGPMNLRARLNRVSNQLSVGLDLTDVPLGEQTTQLAARFAPDVAPVLSRLSAHATINADLNYSPDATPALHHDVRVALKNGKFEHPDLPWPLEKIEASARVVDGRVKLEKATAQSGPMALELALETRDETELREEPVAPKSPEKLKADLVSRKPEAASKSGSETMVRAAEEQLRWLKFTARGVPLDEKIVSRMPGESARKMRRMFDPKGGVDVTYEFTRDAAGWKREFEFRPKNLGIVYEKFRYPVGDVRGWVRRTVTSGGQDSTLLKLYGTAGGQPISIDGQIYGDDEDPAVNLRIAGTNVPIDDTLFAALPGRYPTVVRQFRVAGRGDFVAEIRQPLGVNLLENTFTIDLREANVNYTQFPYPLEKVKGRVIVRTTSTDAARPLRPGEKVRKLPDRDEVVLQEFTGAHAGGTIRLHGSKQPIPHTTDKKLVMHLDGSSCPADADLRTALAAIKLDGIWNNFSPTGNLTFAADVEILDRGPANSGPFSPEGIATAAVDGVVPAGTPRLPLAPEPEGPAFDPVTDLKLTFNFYGPTVTPTFFPYEVKDLSGWLEYKLGKVDLGQFGGRHGETRLKLTAGDVRFYPDGVVWANLGGLELKPFVSDADLLKALPARLRGPVGDLKLKGPAELNVKHLVVLTPADRLGSSAASLSLPATLPLPPIDPSPKTISDKVPGERTNPGTPPATMGARNGSTPELSSRGSAVLARGQAPTSPTSVPTEPDPVIYWDTEIRLLGASMEIGLPWDDVIGAIAIRGRYDSTHLGQVRGNLWFDQVSIAKQPVTRAKVSFTAPAQAPDPLHNGQFLPPRFEFQDLTGILFHGSVGGEARVVLDEPVRYEIWLTATDVQLDEVARHYNLGSDADLKGIAQAQVWFANKTDPKTGLPALVAEGKVDVPTGRMYNLPVLLDLVKVLKLQAPDKTAFEEAHAKFSLQGDRLKVEQLDLIGAAICLGGSGELDTRGDYVRFEFYTIWSQLLKRWLTTPVGDITAFFSKNLFKIKMIRKNGTLTYEGEVVPLITEPTKNILERMKKQAGRLMNK